MLPNNTTKNIQRRRGTSSRRWVNSSWAGASSSYGKQEDRNRKELHRHHPYKRGRKCRDCPHL